MTADPTLTLIALFTTWNTIVFCVYAYDKQAARGGGWRIRERTLILFAVFAGGIGAFACQKWMRHKTKKGPFPILLPVMAMLQGLIALAIALFPHVLIDILRDLLQPGPFA